MPPTPTRSIPWSAALSSRQGGYLTFEGMSEEQKEYEAMKLVGIIDRLNKEGSFGPPCRDQMGKSSHGTYSTDDGGH
ncbi:Synembryn-A [Caligus rogercresseyi]|uniref:Synembryn-A n=1 Tax=Caligus rogercresseyi TaxID=217165 RepID=A0A7T8GL49_CALRO|nr:Synembryn-A [Caligus rogercresseyi]